MLNMCFVRNAANDKFMNLEIRLTFGVADPCSPPLKISDF